MEGGSIQQCNVVPQTERLFESDTDPQIQNRRGGNIYRLDDKKRLLRFLIIGSEQTYYCREKELIRQNADCVDRLIKDGRGVEVVQTIKDISLGGRNVRQNSLLLAYAICARSNDSDTKKAAYKLLSEICRIPTHLFKFIKYCEEESRDEMSDTGTGWGRAHKRAVCKWYTQFERNPEKLARLITKYKTSEQWKHKDVLRLSHTCSKDPVMGFIFSYILNGYMNAIKQYDQALLEMDEETSAKFHKISKLIKVFDDASRCDGVPQLCSLITEYKLTWEQCNRNLLKKKEVWLALLPHMPIEALTRNLGRMSSLRMFAENSEDEQEVVNKLDSINVPTDGVIEGVADEGDDLEDYRPWVTRKSCRHFLHPIKIFIALITYKSGHGDRGNLVWTPNNTICAAMERAFYRAYTALESTGKTFYLSVNVSQSMSQPVQGVTRNISCSTAAAAMLMLTARTEQNCIIKAFCDRAEDLNISPTDTLDEIETKFSNVQSGPTDCAQPMFDAIDMKRKDIDVFVIFTDNETWYGDVHPQVALCQYREYSGNKNVKLVVCGMSATDFTVADKEDPLMLDIVGFDATTPWLISEFARGRL